MAARKFKVGDRVLVVKAPALDSTWPTETALIFKRAVGYTFLIRGFNEIGLAEIWAKDDGSPTRICGNRCNWLWIGIKCLRLVAKKK